MKHQLTGNAGLYHVARELSRRGWHAMPTVRNAKGSDLFAASEDETIVHTIQSKALSKKTEVPLGFSLANLRSNWWIITVDANSNAPVCYILTLDEVRALAQRYTNKTGQDSYWLRIKSYAVPEFKEAWERLGQPIKIEQGDLTIETS